MNKKQYIQPTVEMVGMKMDTALLGMSDVKGQGLGEKDELKYDKSEKKSIWDYAM